MPVYLPPPNFKIGDRPYLILPEISVEPYNYSSDPTENYNLPVSKIVTWDDNGQYGEVNVSAASCLSPMQLRVFILASLGMRIKDIAATFHNSENTVRTHRRIGFEKLEAVDMSSAVTAAFARGIYQVHRKIPTTEPLTGRETDTLVYGAEYDDLEATANILGISKNTVKTYRHDVFRKLGVKSMEAAVLLGHMYGVLEDGISYYDRTLDRYAVKVIEDNPLQALESPVPRSVLLHLVPAPDQAAYPLEAGPVEQVA